MTADSPSYPRSHRAMAERIVAEFDIPHRFVETDEMPNYLDAIHLDALESVDPAAVTIVH